MEEEMELDLVYTGEGSGRSVESLEDDCTVTSPARGRR